jgi:serine/threonine protein kinase
MGIVYKAIRKVDEFPVAVKLMLAKVAVKEKARRRFLREIEIIRELNHRHIVSLVDSGAADSAFYFVTEYCGGGNLSDLVSRRGGRLPLQVLGPLMSQCLEGLEYAHGRGFVHRDIKPSNILLRQQDCGWTAKLADFGLAKQFEQAGFSGMTLTGACGGTYDYMPREQLTDFKNSKPVSDVWSLGATCYRLLTGANPRPCPDGRDPMEVVLRDEHVSIRQRDPSLPPPIARVIDRSLAIDPADRFQDAGEMRRAFEEALQ